MDWVKKKNALISFASKNRYVILILLAGILLILLPSSKESKSSKMSSEIITSLESTTQEQLTEILGHIQGVGEVEVLLTYANGEEIIYQTDNNTSTTSDSSAIRSETITVVDAQRNETGLIAQVNPAVYLGAVIVCQGADDPNTKLAVVDAVSKATGLGVNKISVLKMK